MARKPIPPGAKEVRGPRQLDRLRPTERARYQRSLRVLNRMRHDPDVTLTRAAKEAGTTSGTVLRYAGSGFVRGRGGRIEPAPADRLLRRVTLRTPKGAREVEVRGSRQASRVAKYNHAVDQFLEGDESALTPFQGKTVAGVTLVTDLDVIEEAARRGQMDYDKFYKLT
jgi:hypothetical protein